MTVVESAKSALSSLFRDRASFWLTQLKSPSVAEERLELLATEKFERLESWPYTWK